MIDADRKHDVDGVDYVTTVSAVIYVSSSQFGLMFL